MLEELAKAFCEASNHYKWETTPPSMKQWYRSGVKAAITHLKDHPTEAMLAEVSGDTHIDQDPLYYWDRMLKEALR